MFELPEEGLAQDGRLDTQAQKMVLEGDKQWLILDLEELHEYIRREKKTKVYINDLIDDLEWTIFLAITSIVGKYGIKKINICTRIQ